MTSGKQKRIAILGSTGSVGQQSLEVIKNNPDRFKVILLSAKNNVELLIKQALAFSPKAVIIANKKHKRHIESALSATNITVLAGEEQLKDITQITDFDLLMNALVGISGLEAVIHAIRHGKHIALANKECLVAAGQQIMDEAKKHKVRILPVDSEHSAIFQCIQGEQKEYVEKVFLTASGGPFKGLTNKQLANVTAEQALKHPNWQMGNKISIDSATLINKGMEVISTKWLFELNNNQIEMVLHPQSIVHSLVRFIDGSMKAQLSPPDMRIPIHYALAYPERIYSDHPRIDFSEMPALTFQKLNAADYPCLELALKAMHEGGNMPCAMSAANEVAVTAFLNKQITFVQIPEVIKKCLELVAFVKSPALQTIIETDNTAKTAAHHVIKTITSTKR